MLKSSTPYFFYKEKVYPRIKGIRGAHRLLLLLKNIAARGVEAYDSAPKSIFDREEWNNLIILDACRHDLYEEVKGEEVDSRISLGSTTAEYIKRTFSEGDFEDVVYVSANPFFSDEFLDKSIGGSDIFHEKFDVFNNEWDDELGTVKPESVVKAAKTAKKLFPDKKLIVHFIQPHYPFIGAEKQFSKWGEDGESVWDLAERGEVEREEVWKAYKENLEYVMPYAENLSKELSGKTVVTSDHGNLVGENGLYGHPDRMRLKHLRKVPWVINNG